MSNMTPEQLRQRVLCITGECPAIGHKGVCTYNPADDSFERNSETPQTNKLLQLFADLCGEVIGPDQPLPPYYDQTEEAWISGKNDLRDDQRKLVTKLTGKEMKQ